MPRGGRVRRAIVGLGLALASGIVAPGGTLPAAPAPRAKVVYNKGRSFRIPFNVEDEDRPRIREVQLYVSEDQGLSWRPAGVTAPDQPSFPFRAGRDAEFWFAVRTRDIKGRLFPGSDATVEPSLRVVVDTTAPSLVVEPLPRRGSLAAIRWEVQDEHLDLASLVVEYQVQGSDAWRQVPLARALIGAAKWDAGTAEPVRVRVGVEDKARNRQQDERTLPGGDATAADLTGSDPPDPAAPPPITPISTRPTPVPFRREREDLGDPFAETPPDASPAPASSPFPATPPPEPPPAPQEGGQTLLVGSPRFPLQYAVDDAGPAGAAVVELWATHDGGRSWNRLGQDPDRVTPFPVDLGGEGTFGLYLVARAVTGLGDPPPAPGDPPQSWVEVDMTPPAVQLDPPKVGAGASAGKVAISWRAADPHLAARPVVLSYRPDRPDAIWQQITPPLENTGQYVWTLPAGVPPRFHLRIDAFDSLGNRGSAETTDTGPVIVDRTRPRSRIIGLDPSARAAGPSAHPLR